MKRTPGTPKPKLSHAQHVYLEGKLNDAANRKRRNIADGKVPPEIANRRHEIRRLEKIVQRWYDVDRARQRLEKDRIDKERDKAYQVLLFGTPEQAQEAVKMFEKLRIK